MTPGRGAGRWLRWLLGVPIPPVLPPARMTPEQAAAVARATMAAAKLPFGTMPPQLLEVEGVPRWRVDSGTVGAGWRVEIDDRTGVAGPVTWWGAR